MSSVTFGNLINQYPSEKPTIERIDELFSTKGREYPLEGVFHLSNPSSSQVLMSILAYLVQEGVIAKSFRVVSPSDQCGIQDFSSLYEIPETIYDWHSGSELEITPSNVSVIYKSL